MQQNQKLATLRSLSQMKSRVSTLVKTFENEINKGTQENMDKQIEDTKMKKGTLSPLKKFKNIKRNLQNKINELFCREHQFQFKILCPWMVLTEGDMFGAH